MIAVLWFELKTVVRDLSGSKWFVATCAITLTVGLGLSCLIFSAGASLLWPPSGASRPDRLVKISWSEHTGSLSPVPDVIFDEVNSAAGPGVGSAIQQVAAYLPSRRPLIRDDMTSWLLVEAVSESYFNVLDIKFQRGRPIDSRDAAGAAPVVVSQRLAAVLAPSRGEVLGQTIRLGKQLHTIVGIAPVGFKGLSSVAWFPVDAWVPLDRTVRARVLLVARLSVSGTPTGVHGELQSIATKQSVSGRPQVTLLSAVLVHESVDHLIWPVVTTLGVAIALLMLVCSLNVCALMFARAVSRAPSFAQRAALGASRNVLLSRGLIESALISVIASIASFWSTLAVAPLFAQMTLSISGVQLSPQLKVDGWLALFCGVLTLGCMIAVGMWPSISQSMVDPAIGLPASGSTIARSATNARMRLLAVQIASSVALLVVASGLAYGYRDRMTSDLGFREAGLALIETDLSYTSLTDNQKDQLLQDLGKRITSSGLSRPASALATHVPFDGDRVTALVSVEPDQEASTPVQTVYISPGYFRTMGIGLHVGRDFVDQDQGSSEPVGIVSKEFARAILQHRQTIGNTVRQWETDATTIVRVIGIVDDVAEFIGGSRPVAVLFRPLSQATNVTRLKLVSRADNDPDALRNAAVEFRLSASTLPILRSASVSSLRAEQLIPFRFGAELMSTLGILGFAIAIVGVSGMVSQTARERSREYAIRMALGATAYRVALHLCGRIAPSAMTGAVVGTVIGIALSIVGARFAGSARTDIGPGLAIGSAALILTLVSGATVAWLRCRMNLPVVLREN